MDLSTIKSELERRGGQNRSPVRADESWVVEPFKSFLSNLPSDKQLVLSSSSILQNNVLTIPCTLGTATPWSIPGIAQGNIQVDQSKSILQFSQAEDGADLVKITLEGTLTIASKPIKLIGELWGGNQVSFSLAPNSATSLSLNQIATFIDYADLKSSFLNQEEIFQTLSLEELQLSFGFASDALTHLMLRADSPPDKPWPIIKLDSFPTLSQVGVTVDYYFTPPNGKSYYGNVHANLNLGKPPEALQIRLPFLEPDSWLIEFLPAAGKQTLPGLSAFAGAVGGAALQQSLQQGFQQVQFPVVAALVGAYITCDLQQKKLGNVRLQGLIQIGDVQFLCDIFLPNLAVYGSLPPDHPIKLKQLFKSYFTQDTVDFPEIDITVLNLRAEPDLGQYELSAEIIIDTPPPVSTGSQSQKSLQLNQKPLKLKRIAFEITKTYANISGRLDCTFDIEGAEFRAYASRLPSNLGWEFSAYLSDQKGLNLRTWLGNFGVTWPSSLEGASIEQLSMSFSTANSDFRFVIYGKIQLNSEAASEIALRLDVAVSQQETVATDNNPATGNTTPTGNSATGNTTPTGNTAAAKSTNVTFGGYLTAVGRQFDLIFRHEGQSNEFVAVYDSLQGDTITLQDLIKSISSGAAKDVPNLSITLKHAQFAFQSITKDNATTSKVLFGVDMSAGVNLSDFSNLPLIGATLPREQTLSLAFQILAASGTFEPADLQGFNRLTLDSTTKLPDTQRLTSGFDLRATLRLGNSPIQLTNSALNGYAKGQLQNPSAPASPTPPEGGNGGGFTPTTPTANIRWFSLQKSFGPVYFEQVGVGYQTGNVDCLLDGALTAAGLTVSLNGLGASFALAALSKPQEFKPTFDLKGLGIDYRNGSLEIGGAFLKQTVTQAAKPGETAKSYTAYAGIAVIRTEKLSLTAIGSYSSYNGHPSLYIYAVLNYPLGGPPFFFITGFAAGFGYNRALTIPAIDAIATFPLVEEATKGDDAQSPTSPTAETITAKLQKLEGYIQPSVGDIFIAAGIKFTTFKQVNSFALLIVKFGQRFEIDLLGLSTLVAPPTEVNGGKDPVAEVQLALKATFIPIEGFLSIQAQLTPNSYILSKACQLTGGFAFFCWFKKHPSGAEAGDFVITLGGYHPKYIVPKHYPIVPRLGINWQVNKPEDPYELVIKGQAYFALTAQALMAGGNLEALWSCTWKEGTLKAWFKAGADFIITWQPYHYDASFYIDIGASYTFQLFGTQTITVDVGADLHIWGPEFAGTATIHLWIISVTVNFGDQTSKGLESIDWATFKKSFLPKKEQICSINVQKGLVRQIKDGTEDRWIVNPKDFVFATNSVIPSSKAYLVHPTPPDAQPTPPTPLSIGTAQQNLAIASMDIDANITSKQMITITYEGNDISDQFKFEPISKMVPAALWGKPNRRDGKLIPPDLNAKQFVENTLAGFEIRPANSPTEGSKASKNLQQTSAIKTDAFSWSNFDLGDLDAQHKVTKVTKDSIKTIQDSVVVNSSRDELLKALGWVNPEIDFGEPIQQSLLVTA